jgi:hypothetical protein
MAKFVNEAKQIDPTKDKWMNRPSSYTFDNAPRLLFMWSGLFQKVVSQVGTFVLTGKYHD